MKVVQAAAAFIAAAMAFAAASSFAQVRSPGTGAPLPAAAQKAPPMQQGSSADLSALMRAVSELTARVDRLEGNLSESDVVGTYTLQYLQVALLSNPPRTRVDASRSAPLGGVEHLTTAGTLEVAANGQFSLATRETGFTGNLLGLSMTGVDRSPPNETGSWSFAGNTLSLTFAGSSDPVALSGAVGGRLFIFVGSNPDDGTSTLVLLVKNPR